MPDLPVVYQPAVNEELGATAVMGSQPRARRPTPVRRRRSASGTARRPASTGPATRCATRVFAGTSQHGGAVALVGDDPAAKIVDTAVVGSDATLSTCTCRSCTRATSDEVLELGLHAVAMSRACGLWTAMKIVAAVADGAGTVDLHPERERPGHARRRRRREAVARHPSGGSSRRRTLELEQRVPGDPPARWPALRRRERAEPHHGGPRRRLDRHRRSGFTYRELLRGPRAGSASTDERAIADAGIRLLQLRMPVPFDPDIVRRSPAASTRSSSSRRRTRRSSGSSRTPSTAAPTSPVVIGKTHEDGRTLMRATGRSTPTPSLAGAARAGSATRLADRLAPPTAAAASSAASRSSPSAARRSSAPGARTTGRPRCPRERSSAPASGATGW